MRSHGRFKAPFITPAQAWAKADEIRLKHWQPHSLPIDPEIILQSMGLHLDTVSSLRLAGDVDALLRVDLPAIIVDAEEYMDDRKQNRMRFSIAHELGHYVLHSDIYKKLPYTTVEEWITFIDGLPEDQWSFIEQQAYEFAGRLLVPRSRLESEVKAALVEAENAGFMKWDESGDAAKEYMANSICRVFGVSSQVIEKRMMRESIWPLSKLRKT